MSRILTGDTRYSKSDYRRREEEYYEQQTMKRTCGFCKWKFEGTVAEGREKARLHREDKHPETLNIRRPRKSGRALSTFRYTSMDDQAIAEVETERKRRAYLNGVDLDVAS